ncbi:MAG TPA: ABC transporter ATP-binding protein, partial [Anaerolineales bacterium]|nr:ABC transporter ATP-binding protein [Anaerolineales bacterium]
NIRSHLILSVNNLQTRFHTPEGTVYAVNDVSFDLHESETLAIVGESGCGKSVSMLSILGLIAIPPGEISHGEAIYLQRDLLKCSEKELDAIRGKEIAMIFQDPMTSLNPVLTIGYQITESLRYHLAMSQPEADRRAIEMLESVGIPDAASRLNSYPHQFSGGMRQRVMIAMALACSPSLLIADEPTTALDVTIQAQITELVQELRQRLGMAIIWITHDLGVVAGLADRVIVMYAGYIVEEAQVFDLYEHPHHPYTMALLAALPRVDLSREQHLQSIPGSPPNLLVEPVGCPFAARCEFVFERCVQERPPLFNTGAGHSSACWLDPATGKPRQ